LRAQRSNRLKVEAGDTVMQADDPKRLTFANRTIAVLRR